MTEELIHWQTAISIHALIAERTGEWDDVQDAETIKREMAQNYGVMFQRLLARSE